jgi:cytochrome c oxidase subunit 3
MMGVVNTVILLTGSLTIVLATAHLERKNRKQASLFLGATMLLGIAFLINRYFEWAAKFNDGLYPNSEILQQHTAGENVFYSLYYLMTGLHGLHIVIGLIVMTVMFYLLSRKPRRKISQTGINNSGISLEDVTDEQAIKLENAGLYWHMMNVIWIFLFPLLYLVT